MLCHWLAVDPFPCFQVTTRRAVGSILLVRSFVRSFARSLVRSFVPFGVGVRSFELVRSFRLTSRWWRLWLSFHLVCRSLDRLFVGACLERLGVACTLLGSMLQLQRRMATVGQSGHRLQPPVRSSVPVTSGCSLAGVSSWVGVGYIAFCGAIN